MTEKLDDQDSSFELPSSNSTGYEAIENAISCLNEVLTILDEEKIDNHQ